MGPVSLSRLSGKPIIPVAWSVDRFWRAPGWDGMRIPKPLSRGVLVVGPPINPPESHDREVMEAQRRTLETIMNDTLQRADMITGAPDDTA